MATYQLFKLPKNTQIDSSVRVTPGAKAYFYETLTSTPQDTYTTSARNVAHPNPVVADGNGVFPAIYLDPALEYKLTLTTSADVLIYTIDPINDQILSQETIGAFLYPRTDAEALATITNYSRPPGHYERYGADPSGSADSYDAIVEALTCNTVVYGEPGATYKNATGPIVITGDKIIYGSLANAAGLSASPVTFLHTAASGSMWSATSTEFGSVFIGFMAITGGNGSYAITSTRPQSKYQCVYMEGAGYNGGGIHLSSASQGSWSSSIVGCKWVGPASQNAYRGYLIDINGGSVDIHDCTATRGSVGLEILKGETIRIGSKCNFNGQDSSTSSESESDGQCSIRLSGSGSKKTVSISSTYLEGSTTLLWIEDVENMEAEIFGDDLGAGNTGCVKIRSADSCNVTIKNSNIRARLNGGICITNAGSNTTIMGSKLITDGNSTSVPLVNTGVGLITINNRITGNVSGNAISTTTAMLDIGNVLVSGGRLDASGLTQFGFPNETAFTAVVLGSGTAGTYEIASQNCSMSFDGRRAWVDIDITLAGALTAGGTGDLIITGIPITKRNNTLPMGTAVFGGVDWGGNYANVGFSSSGTSTTLVFYQTTDNGAISFLPISGVAANDTIRASISFRI